MTTLENAMQRRAQLLLGSDNISRIREAKVLIFGVGGVGSWCAESLVRNGIRHLTIVDSDRICVTNCNRQLMATSRTIGQVKVEAMRERLLELNPSAEITALPMAYDATTADSFHLENYDYIIDAIDSLSEKADLILRATALPRTTMLISSMGAALRRDPFMVRKAEFWQVKGDALARALRNKFKKMKVFPKRKFLCVYSEEQPMKNLGECNDCKTEGCLCGKEQLSQPESPDWNARKAQINGSLCQITATFGMAISSIVINDIIDRKQ